MVETLKFVSPAGPEAVLSSGDLSWLRGVGGRGMPPVDLTERKLAAGAGSVATLVRDAARTVDVPVIVTGELRAALRTAVGVLDPTGEGKLVAEDVAAGWARELPCRYVGGFEWDEQFPHAMKQLLSFWAGDPYWRDTADTTATFAQGDRGLWLPFPPMTVIADDVFAQATIANDGDVEAWPVWTITGPVTTVTLAADTGETLKVAYALTAGETLTIDTRPSAKTVTDQDGANRFSSLDTALDDLFGFPVGTTVVDITIEGATSASEVALAWRRRFRSA